MTPKQFVDKWSQIQQKETAVSQSHFNDICALVGHPPPLAHDPTGNTFSFETQTVKPDGLKGFADVYFKGKFVWEYKGPHKDLDKAYQQLQLYREALENPPLLITSDIHRIIIHTNFNNYPKQRHEIGFDDILNGRGVQLLQWVFYTPEKFTPQKTQQQITKASADTFVAVADSLKQHQAIMGETYTAEQLAHFLVRLLFSLFAEDLKLLPDALFTMVVKARGDDYRNLQDVFRELFAKMRTGGMFGYHRIRHFNGTLFDDDFVPSIPHDLGIALLRAAEQDWSEVDPSIFGTLFERVIDEGKRAQLGAHYTSEDDIMLIVEPVLMEPLKRQWDDVRRQVDRELRQSSIQNRQSSIDKLTTFAHQIASTTVLDPACGSGNFLYVALRELLNLQKQVIAYAARKELPPIPLTVSPEQLYGIEINPYAHELAQITAWIGYLQWRNENGFGDMPDPILRPLHNIQRMDAILAYDDNGRPVEPEWPAADVIIGNPPFLGNSRMIGEFGEDYVFTLRSLYAERLPSKVELVGFWFDRASEQIKSRKSQRAGLIATQSLRNGLNRTVLEKIKNKGDIFLAWSDQPWIQDGASVRVALIGFDDGSENNKFLDGQPVANIHPNLTSGLNMTLAQRLDENLGISNRGVEKYGAFDLTEKQAAAMLNSPNPTGVSNSDVLKPLINGNDITSKSRNRWVIDFGVNTSIEEAQKYIEPFAHVEKYVKPTRETDRRKHRRERWWLFGETMPSTRKSISKLERYCVTPRVAKHRLFVFLPHEVLPDTRLYVFGREDNYFFGVLHSRVHEVWSLATSSRHGVGNDPTYNNTTCFETFPFPWPPGHEPTEANSPLVAEIAHWARELVQWRDAWLNPPRDGIYAGLGSAYDTMLKKRTLTNLYNGLQYYRETVRAGQLFLQTDFDKVTRKSVTRADIQELDDIHTALDRAVFDAYGWPHTLTDEQILERLLALNLERAAAQEGG